MAVPATERERAAHKAALRDEIQGTGRPESPNIPIVTRSTLHRRSGTKTVRQGNNRVDSAGYAPKGATVRIVINKRSNAEPMSICPVRHRRLTRHHGPEEDGDRAPILRAYPLQGHFPGLPQPAVACHTHFPAASYSGLVPDDASRTKPAGRGSSPGLGAFLLAHPARGAINGNCHCHRFLRDPLLNPARLQRTFLHHVTNRKQPCHKAVQHCCRRPHPAQLLEQSRATLRGRQRMRGQPAATGDQPIKPKRTSAGNTDPQFWCRYSLRS